MKLRYLIACLFASAGALAGCGDTTYPTDSAAATTTDTAAAGTTSGATASTQTASAGSAPAASTTPSTATSSTSTTPSTTPTDSSGTTSSGSSGSSNASSPATTPTSNPTTNPLLSRTVKIWCIGDSMTVGAEYIAGSTRSYRGRLYQLLTAAGYSVDFIGTQQMDPAVGGDPDEDGYNGAWIGPGGQANNLADRMPALLPQVDPDIVIMAFGWNSVYNEPSLAAQKYGNIVTLIGNAKPNAQLMLATLSPQRGESEAQSTSTVAGYGDLNTMARNLANASPTDKLWLADIAPGGFQYGDYWDVIHWFQSGADIAANTIYQSLINGPLKR